MQTVNYPVHIAGYVAFHADIPRYSDPVTGYQRQEVEDQSTIIAHLAYKAAQSKITKYLGPVGRNEPCPCGSGKKYKKCHGA